jgi:hypothetical protein
LVHKLRDKATKQRFLHPWRDNVICESARLL